MILRADNKNTITVSSLRDSVTNEAVTDAVLKLTLADPATKKAVTGATNASPIVISCANHNFYPGDQVLINNVEGNYAANAAWTVGPVSQNSFQLVDSIGSGAWISGGEVYKAVSGAWNLGMTYDSDRKIYYVDLDSDVPLTPGKAYYCVVQMTNGDAPWKVEGPVSVQPRLITNF